MLAINVVAAIATFYVTESPRYLFGMERYDDARAVLVKFAKRNGVKDYEPRTFEEETTILIEQMDPDRDTNIRTSGGPGENEEGFAHLLPAAAASPTEGAVRPTAMTKLDINKRYMTNTGVVYRPTIRETVSNLHETVTGIRMTSHLYLIGVDKTQSIALDELWSAKPRDETGVSRQTRVFRKTRVSEAQP